MSSDVAADIASGDSLSFAGLVCLQDQHPKSQSGHVLQPSPTKNGTRIQKQDQEFEFSQSATAATAQSPNNNSLADVLFSNGQLLPEAIPFQSNQSQVLGHITCKDLLQPSSKKHNTQVRNKANKERPTASNWFGQKIFRSFATPCRDCRTLEPSPSMKERTLPQQGNIKLQ